ncbi:IclR family transcriptional regulator [Mycobacterium marseillense]|uniref:IclR family transcriptional regulator n=1 Tax=Mycobacterium marseillense TaxID=701042 RepID=UPI0025928691|nr:IclR family transcriptional regulator [Mycobacterium marseillense]MDM3975311.1 IclR family transcriptional regulator [Mycobacterium marseillense]
MLQTVQKIGPVLDLFTVQRPDWGVTQVAEAIGLPRSSAHALLASLVETGLLRCQPRGRYRLGWRVVELNETLRGSIDLQAVASAVLQRLVDQHGETVHLAVMQHGRVLYLDKLPGTRQLTVAGARVGTQLEAHCSAVGKVLLAYCHAQELQRFLAGAPLRRLTPATKTDPLLLRAELDTIRASGIGFDECETVGEVSCVAAPIRDDSGVVVAALSLTAPSGRLRSRRNEYRRSVKAAALEISHRLDGDTSPRLNVVHDGPAVATSLAPSDDAPTALRALSSG